MGYGWLIAYPCRYNTSEHPIAFHKAQDLGKSAKKLEGGPAPDLEDAFEVSLPPRSLGVARC